MSPIPLVPSPTLCLVGASPQVTVQVQGQEVLSEKMEPSSFQPLPQTPDPGRETPPGAVEELPLAFQVKEEPEVTEEPGESKQSGLGLLDKTVSMCLGSYLPPNQFSSLVQPSHLCPLQATALFLQLSPK